MGTRGKNTPVKILQSFWASLQKFCNAVFECDCTMWNRRAEYYETVSLSLGALNASYILCFSLWNEISLMKLRNHPKDCISSRVSETHDSQRGTYFSSGRFLTLVAISDASGHSFSTSSRGPKNDLFCPIKVFFATGSTQRCLRWELTASHFPFHDHKSLSAP